MNPLDEIRDSAYQATERHTKGNAYLTDTEEDRARLLAALDAADKELSHHAEMLRETADGFMLAVINRDEHRDPELANRYDAYAAQARAALVSFRRVITTALDTSKPVVEPEPVPLPPVHEHYHLSTEWHYDCCACPNAAPDPACDYCLETYYRINNPSLYKSFKTTGL